jgi:hypothetical protein
MKFESVLMLIIFSVFQSNCLVIDLDSEVDTLEFGNYSELFVESMTQNIRESKNAFNNESSKLKHYLNPIYWLKKLLESIPDIGFWIFGIKDSDCRYLTICETSNFIVRYTPNLLLSLFRGSSNDIFSNVLGETAYIEAWTLGLIKSVDCNFFYNCTYSPFQSMSKK